MTSLSRAVSDIMAPPRIAIVGSREALWTPEERIAIRALVFSLVDKSPRDAVIISGESPGGGVDVWAREAAEAHGRTFVAHPPSKYTSRSRKFSQAAMMRNQDIVEDCTELYAFPAPLAKGTWDTVRRAKKAGRVVTVKQLVRENPSCPPSASST